MAKKRGGFDPTSFNFGANAKPRGGKGKKGKKKGGKKKPPGGGS